MKKNTEIPFNKSEGNIAVAKRLLVLDQQQRHAVLATDNYGQPYTSLVAFALTGDGRGVLFATPKKTSKYKNILVNNKVSPPHRYKIKLGKRIYAVRGCDNLRYCFIIKKEQKAG